MPLDPERVSRLGRGPWKAGSLVSEGGPCPAGLEGALAPRPRSLSVYTTVPFSPNALSSSGGCGQRGAARAFITPSSGTTTRGNTANRKGSERHPVGGRRKDSPRATAVRRAQKTLERPADALVAHILKI